MSRTRPETKIAIIGGTGELGFGLAVRLAKAYSVTIGSRDVPKAAAAAAKASTVARSAGRGEDERRGRRRLRHRHPRGPRPSLGRRSRLNGPEALTEKLVISPIVPMVFKDGIFSISTLRRVRRGTRRQGASNGAESPAPSTRSPPPRLAKPRGGARLRVLVTADSREVFDQAARVVSSVGRLRPLYAGPLPVSRMVEAITPALSTSRSSNKLKSPSIKMV